jgi:hypothetical protein
MLPITLSVADTTEQNRHYLLVPDAGFTES